MILALDAYYCSDKAKVSGVVFTEWNDNTPVLVKSTVINGVNEYESGAFYKRELPCLIEFIKTIDLSKITTIVIDGFVYLSDDKKKGLGAHLFDYLDCTIPVVGVAKSSFYSIKNLVREVLRGNSNNPLFITTAGIELSQAAKNIKDMAGPHRIPTLLKIVDKETRTISCS